MMQPGSRKVPDLSRPLFWILLLGLAGTGAELLLMEHTDGWTQLIPLILIAAGAGALVWFRVGNRRTSRLALRTVMLLSVVSGIVGTLLHYRGNVEFEVENMPGIGGWELFKAAMTGATPALAPGTMILLGLLGLVFSSSFHKEEP